MKRLKSGWAPSKASFTRFLEPFFTAQIIFARGTLRGKNPRFRFCSTARARAGAFWSPLPARAFHLRARGESRMRRFAPGNMRPKIYLLHMSSEQAEKSREHLSAQQVSRSSVAVAASHCALASPPHLAMVPFGGEGGASPAHR